MGFTPLPNPDVTEDNLISEISHPVIWNRAVVLAKPSSGDSDYRGGDPSLRVAA